MNLEYLLNEKIADDVREEHHKLELLKEDDQKIHATLSVVKKSSQPGLFDYMKNTWNEMLEQSQSAKKYF